VGRPWAGEECRTEGEETGASEADVLHFQAVRAGITVCTDQRRNIDALMPTLYFAAPLFSSAERTFNLALTERLERAGLTVFLPQRDGAESDRKPYSGMSKADRRQAMFNLDRDKILESDVFLYVLDGRVPDEGAAFELGVAYEDKMLRTTNRLIIGLHTDARAAFLGSRLNPMLDRAFDFIASSEDEACDFIEGWGKDDRKMG
jgi:nucleoside 2-deoxyribosyltransferase